MTYISLMLKMTHQGISVQCVIKLLKTGLTSISMQDINYIENYIIEFGIKGYNLEREFRKNNKEEQWNLMNYDLKRLNAIRENIVGSINNFSLAINKATNAKELVQTIYDHLLENDVINRYTEEILAVKEETDKIASIRKQTIEKIYDSLDNIVSVLSDEKAELKTFIELFEFSINDLDISTIPMMQDEIVICDINKTRIAPKKTIYIIGAYENGLPGNAIEDPVLTDSEIEKLKKAGLDIIETSLSRMNMELFNIYFAISKAKENLIITVPASKITGEPLRPSILINEIRMITGKKLDGKIVETDTERKFKKLDGTKLTNKIAFRNLLENIDISNAITDLELIETKEMYDYYLNNEENNKYSKILNYARTDENLKQETLEKLYGENIKSSVSRLEMFKRCPFSYYTNYILGVKTRVTYKLSTMDMGTLMHNILEGFSKWLLERDIAWQQIINEENIKEKA
ncbi:MAG: PD-(D/E)XK nuclease family protein, partial [Clostridia bacterium]|nr:PD-(D/E)XK nuclease family protein [Clostridia bacterium]